MKRSTASLLFAALAGLASAQTYRVQDLYNLGNGFYSPGVAGINNRGEVVGYSYTPSNRTHAFLYTGGQMRDLAFLGGFETWDSGASAINDQGEVLGSARGPAGAFQPFLYSNGAIQNLSGIGPYAINNQGQIVGVNANGSQHAHLLSNGSLTDLGTLGGSTSTAYGINDAGQVVGSSLLSPVPGGAPTDAFLYQNGAMADLGSLGGRGSIAYAINNQGQVAGVTSVADPNVIAHAFLWENGTMRDIDTLGGSFSSAKDVNNLGQAVGGWRMNGDSVTRGFYYADGVSRDLTTMLDSITGDGWTINDAVGINDHGQIAAQATKNGLGRVVLLTPVPEPASLAALGLGALAVVRRRRTTR